MLVFTGPSGSGKTHRILTAFREAVRGRRSDTRLVVPTATLVRHLRNELAREGLVFSPKSVLTLSAFTSEICSGVALADTAHLTLAIEAAVTEVDSPEFARVDGMPGFHAALVATIGELDAAGCEPEQFSRLMPDAPLAEPLLAVWRTMERQLSARGLLTRSQALRRAASEIRNRPTRELSQQIWFDGFVGFARPELELIEALASKEQVTVALPSLPTAGPALRDLRAAGFRVEELAGRGIPPDAEWFQAENLERETDEIARRILVEHSAGREFREMAVVLRNPEDLAPLLETTFERFGIPARYYFSTALKDHPVAGFSMHVIEAVLSGWDLETALTALRLAPGLTPDAAMDCWDIAIREHIPGEGLATLRDLAGGEPRLLERVERFSKIDAWRAANWCPQEWARLLSMLPERFRPNQPLDVGRTNVAIDRGQVAATAEWSTAMQTAASWYRPVDAAITLGEFWRTAESIIRLTTFTVPDGRHNIVHVMSVFEARQWDPAVTFIPNLIEKVFPRYHPQDPFLPDTAMRQLQAHGIRIRDTQARDEEEACLFDAVSQRPERKLILSYPRMNGRGEANLPSSFFARLPAAVESPVRLVRPMLPSPAITVRAVSALHSPDLLARIEQRHATFSPSGLETYARCPFQFFSGKTLRLESLPDSPGDRLSYLVQGNIVHDVLRQWTAGRGDVKPHFDAVFAAACAKDHIQASYRTEMLRQQLLDDLQSFCASFQTFGDGAILTEQSFELTVAGVRVRGRIDRLETSAIGGAIVVDYKYSNNTRQNVNDETKLQGVLYTIAAERTLGQRPQATVFLSVKSAQKPVGWGELPGHDLAPLTPEWIEKGITTVERVAREIREGTVRPQPSNSKHCEYCEFRDACRFEEAEAVREASGR